MDLYFHFAVYFLFIISIFQYSLIMLSWIMFLMSLSIVLSLYNFGKDMLYPACFFALFIGGVFVVLVFLMTRYTYSKPKGAISYFSYYFFFFLLFLFFYESFYFDSGETYLYSKEMFWGVFTENFVLYFYGFLIIFYFMFFTMNCLRKGFRLRRYKI